MTLDEAISELADYIENEATDIAAEAIEIEAMARAHGTTCATMPPTIVARIKQLRNQDPERWDGMS